MKTEQTQILMATKVIKAGVCHMLTSFRYRFRSLERADIGCIIASFEDLAQKGDCRKDAPQRHRGHRGLYRITSGVIAFMTCDPTTTLPRSLSAEVPNQCSRSARSGNTFQRQCRCQPEAPVSHAKLCVAGHPVGKLYPLRTWVLVVHAQKSTVRIPLCHCCRTLAAFTVRCPSPTTIAQPEHQHTCTADDHLHCIPYGASSVNRAGFPTAKP